MDKPVFNPDFVSGTSAGDLPDGLLDQAELIILDLLGVAIAGSQTKLSRIIRDHATAQFGGHLPLLLDGRMTSPAGFALAGGMTIDAMDAHDGYNPAKGHIGCGLFPATLAVARDTDLTDGREFLTGIVIGYELASRLAVALHATTPDYHTSGAWVAVAAAAVGARFMKMSATETAHAMGIAEYHGPRSQMMRCIDDPTMLKDGSGWGAMAGVSAVYLARAGFTGAPAVTFGQPGEVWEDLGHRWLTQRQYFKPYPVCRWAQAPIEAALSLQRAHDLRSTDIAAVEVASFHESTRLAVNEPQTTEEAQYSTSFPTAVALARGRITPEDVSDEALRDPEILRLSRAMTMIEDHDANSTFPTDRRARVTLSLHDGTKLESGWHTPRWDPEYPPSPDELREKFHAYAGPVVGHARAKAIEASVAALKSGDIRDFYDLLAQPAN